MDKQLILSVAGSGKTTFIINSLSIEKRSLVITFTENNYYNLRIKIIKRFGLMPENIIVMTYFEFLYSFCYKPFLHYKINSNGYNFNQPLESTLRMKRTDIKYYCDGENRLYHCRLAKLLEVKGVIPKVTERVNKYFDEMYVDEVQDFAGHDFNFLLGLTPQNTVLRYVGDYYQHTFDTSRDGNVNSSLHDDYKKYIERFIGAGFVINTSSLSKSYRCSKAVCEYVCDNTGIEIQSHSERTSDIELVTEQEQIKAIMEDDRIIKLFYQNSKKYSCKALNWGDSKGLDCFEDVCVILNNATYKKYKDNNLRDLNEKTKKKFYVACTRAKNNLIMIPESLIMDYKV